jgi:hypothetical protein
MRDIRPDLQERLQSILNKRQSLQRRLDALAVEETLLTSLLRAEDAAYPPCSLFDALEEPELTQPGPIQPDAPLSEVLLSTLKEKSGMASLDELKESASKRGFSFGAKQPGRVIHFALIGMSQHKLVEKKDGRWTLVQQAAS